MYNKHMKIIFLDVDGVLNDELAYKDWKENPDKETFEDSDIPTNQHMAQLKKIVDATGAEIVLSSAWRGSIWGMRTVLERFNDYGLKLLSITDEGVSESVLEASGFKNITPRSTSKRTWSNPVELVINDRGAEIAGWLLRQKSKNIESFIILDDEDEDIIEYFPDNLIKTSYMTGLTDNDVEKAIAILNQNG